MTDDVAFRRARKEAMVAANLAGVEATLRAGRESDERHNVKPVPRRIVTPVVEQEEVKVKVEPVREQEKAKEEAVVIPKKSKENVTLSELEQLKATIAKLEREMGTENKT